MERTPRGRKLCSPPANKHQSGFAALDAAPIKNWNLQHTTGVGGGGVEKWGELFETAALAAAVAAAAATAAAAAAAA